MSQSAAGSIDTETWAALSLQTSGTTLACCRYVFNSFFSGANILQYRLCRVSAAQVVSDPSNARAAAEACQRLRNEWVVRVTGAVRRRKSPNPNLPTGQVELCVEDLAVLNSVSGSLPFLPVDEMMPREETRLRHRVLDLRYALLL